MVAWHTYRRRSSETADKTSRCNSVAPLSRAIRSSYPLKKIGGMISRRWSTKWRACIRPWLGEWYAWLLIRAVSDHATTIRYSHSRLWRITSTTQTTRSRIAVRATVWLLSRTGSARVVRAKRFLANMAMPLACSRLTEAEVQLSRDEREACYAEYR